MAQPFGELPFSEGFDAAIAWRPAVPGVGNDTAEAEGSGAVAESWPESDPLGEFRAPRTHSRVAAVKAARPRPMVVTASAL